MKSNDRRIEGLTCERQVEVKRTEVSTETDDIRKEEEQKPAPTKKEAAQIHQ